MEWAIVLHDQIRTARKEHKCRECYRIIEKGEMYSHEGLLLDGSKSTHKTCRHCRVIRGSIVDALDHFVYSGVADDVWYIASKSYDKAGYSCKIISAGIKNKWKNKRGEYWKRIWDGTRTINVDKEMKILREK